jgi:large subunit ribosomal protein L9
MKVILIQSVPTLGKAGEIKNVADGYAVNYLLPRKLAAVADAKNVEQMKIISTEIEKQDKEAIENQKKQAQKISGMELKILAKAKDGKLFGSVGAKEIKKALESGRVAIESSRIILAEPIKEIGEKEIVIRFNKNIEAKITVKIEEE